MRALHNRGVPFVSCGHVHMGMRMRKPEFESGCGCGYCTGSRTTQVPFEWTIIDDHLNLITIKSGVSPKSIYMKCNQSFNQSINCKIVGESTRVWYSYYKEKTNFEFI